MSLETKKKNTPQTRNKEQIATLKARLKEMGDLSLTLPVALEVVNITDKIEMLKRNPTMTFC